MKQLEKFLTKKNFWQYCHQLIWTDKLSQRTAKRKLASLKKFCQWGVEKGLLRKNPFEEDKEGQEGIEGTREIGGVREIGKIGLILTGVVLSVGILKMSLAKLPSPEIPKAIPLPAQIASQNVAGKPKVLSQISGFGERIGEIGQISQIGLMGLSASENTLLRQLTDQGKLTLPQNLGIEAKEISVKTTDAYDGSITINPDGRGALNLLFEGQSPKDTAGVGGFVNIQNANLQEGNLIYAGVANDQTKFNFLQFQGGADLHNRFTVDGQGNIETSGNLNLGSGAITSPKNLIFSPQDQPTLTLGPKQSLLKGNLAISGQLYDGGLGIFGTTGERLPQTFDFTEELTIEFEFLTGLTDLTIKFNLNEKGDKYYQALWQTDKTFAIQTCDPDCTSIGSVAYYPFEESSWHHGRIHINDSYLTWELDLSAQKVSVPVQIKDLPLLSSGYVQFSESFEAIAGLKVTQGNNVILTSGHGQVGGNLEVSGGLRVGQLSDISSSTHVCRNALGDLATCAADYAEWYPVALSATENSKFEIRNPKQIPNSNDQNSKHLKSDSSDISDLSAIRYADSADSADLPGSLVSITNLPNPVDDPTARYMAAPAKKPYDKNLLGVLGNPDLGANGRKLAENYQPLVLAGRVLIKVSNVNGPIAVGDAITSSEITGVGMRATEAGSVVGTALEPWPKTSGESGKSGKILVFINPGWHYPENIELYLTSLIIERLRTTGQAEIAAQLIAQSLQVTGEATVAGELTAESLTTTSLKNQFGDLLARVEQLESGNEEEQEVEEVIEGPEETEGPESSETFELLASVDQFIKELQEVQVSAYTNDITNDISISEDIEIRDTRYVISDTEYELANPQILNTKYQILELTVLGQTSLGHTTIAGNLLVDSSLQIGANSINSLDNTLYLQSYGFGGMDILGGKVKIDPQGNLAVAGNVEVEKDLRVKRSLFASLIKPIGEIVTIEGDLKTTGSGTFNKIIIASAKTGHGIRDTGHEENILEEKSAPIPKYQIPNTKYQISTNASAGTAILPAGKTELLITNNSITNDSLVYITPLSPTENKVLFVKAKKGTIQCPETPEVSLPTERRDSSTPALPAGRSGVDEICLPQPGYFTVAIDKPITIDIEFNWWVIN